MRQRRHHLHLAASVIALAASGAWVSPALAQQAAAAEPVEAVTVTGTSIRGTAPVGSSVTTVTQADIKATGATPLLVTYPTGVPRVRVEFVESRPGRGLHQSYATPYLDPGFVQFDTYNIEYRYMECSLAAYLAKQERWQLPAVFDDEAATDAACVRNPYM